MDAARFDAFARFLVAPASRRAAGRMLAGMGLAGLLAAPGDAAKDSRKGKKGKTRKPKRNAFGCVDVGGLCTNGGQCCSNICSGKRGRKRCQAHNTGFGACEAGPLGLCAAPDPDGGLIFGTPCTSSADENGLCFTTTGNASYCGIGEVQSAGCAVCAKDKDCETLCGAGAACIQCPACDDKVPGVATACAGVAPDSCVF